MEHFKGAAVLWVNDALRLIVAFLCIADFSSVSLADQFVISGGSSPTNRFSVDDYIKAYINNVQFYHEQCSYCSYAPIPFTANPDDVLRIEAYDIGQCRAYSTLWIHNLTTSESAMLEPARDDGCHGFSASMFHSGNYILPGAAFQNLVITGPSNLPGGSSAPFRAMAYFASGSTQDVTDSCSWYIENVSPFASLRRNELSSTPVSATREVWIRAAKTVGKRHLVASRFVLTLMPSRYLHVEHTAENGYTVGEPITLFAEVRNDNSNVFSYAWHFPGAASHTGTNGPLTSITYTNAGTHSISVTARAGSLSLSNTVHIGIDKPSAAGQPTTPTVPDPGSGYPVGNLDPSNTSNGLIVVTHGLHSSSESTWLILMTNYMSEAFAAGKHPNIIAWDWSEQAIPSSQIEYIPHWLVTMVIWPSLPQEVHAFLYDVVTIREYGIDQGSHLADWIMQRKLSGQINTAKPIHIIGHSAGGFVAGECARKLASMGVGPVQITMLDTPFPVGSHFEQYDGNPYIERFISSMYGLMAPALETPVFTAPAPGGIPLPLPPTPQIHECDIGTRFSVEPSSRYVRTLIPNTCNNFDTGDFGHGAAPLWYSITVAGGLHDGFYFNPFGGHGFHGYPSMMRTRGPGGGPSDAIFLPFSGFDAFGSVTILTNGFQVTEDLDAGIFLSLGVSNNMRSLRFLYRFTSAGDGDYLKVSYGASNVVLLASDTALSRSNAVEGICDLAAYVGQTNVLCLTLVSRGNANAVLEITDFEIETTTDSDADGMDDDDEVLVGTDPFSADTDLDALGDKDEQLVWLTDPLLSDTDGDGAGDFEEVRAGTSPTNAASVFGIKGIRMLSNRLAVAWTGNSNALYSMRRSDAPGEGALSYAIVTNAAPGMGFTAWDVPQGASRGIYWLAITSAPPVFSSAYSRVSLAGTFNGWNPAAMNMALIDNYVWEGDIAISETNAEFKFTANGTWDVNWGDQDQNILTIPLMGTADNIAFGNIRANGVLSGFYRFQFNEQTARYGVFPLP